MLRSVKEISGYTIRARDGDIGKVHDFFFDDQVWTIRYMIVDTGSWLAERKVLISSAGFGKPDSEKQAIPVPFTQEQVESSPEVDTEPPVHRQKEIARQRNLPFTVLAREPIMPMLFPQVTLVAGPAEEKEEVGGDPHLRSMREVIDYHIEARDGEMGHVEDFVFDDEDGRIRYMVVDTRNWLPGKKVMVRPQYIKQVDFDVARVRVDLPREEIENTPEFFDPSVPVN